MDKITKLLCDNNKQFPAWTAADAVKLMFQSYLGAGHLVADEEESLKALRDEYALSEDNSQKCVILLNGLCRYPLSELKEEELEAFNKLFIYDAAHFKPNQEGFEGSFEYILSAVESGLLPFDKDSVRAYLDAYKAAGYPIASHSERYRKAYTPHYRVLTKVGTQMIAPLKNILERSKNGKLIIAIDGRSCAGKSTLAAMLSEIAGAKIVNTDDFYLPSKRRTAARLSCVGGNVDYERIHKEVIESIIADKDIEYGVFDCKKDKIVRTKKIIKGGIIVVEGSYSAHPYFGKYYDILIANDIGSEKQKKRILARDGKKMLERFEGVWIPCESKYFDATKLYSKADYVIKS